MSKSNIVPFIKGAQAVLDSPHHRLKVDRTHHLRVPSQWQFGPRVNHDWHLVYVHRGGRAWYDLPGSQVHLKTNRIIFVPDQCVITACQGKPDGPLITPIRFAQWDTNDAIIPWTSLSGSNDNWMSWEDNQHLGPVFTSIHQWRNQSGASLDVEGETRIDAALRYLFAQLQVMCRQEESPWTRLLDQLQSVRKPWSNQELAEALNVSEKYVVKLFRERLGETPHHYQLRLRCQYACQLLEETTMTVSEVAAHLQYPDGYAFSKQFKQFVGSSPRHYRDTIRRRQSQAS